MIVDDVLTTELVKALANNYSETSKTDFYHFLF